ncbi:hypothetical protein A9320_19395 [Ruegeria sp. PBVC088]|uniref:Uncharacterized protein n=1 Tax=Mameliella alba TaxID=561184 RepID=A0A0B3S918_9RHOB|nr:hypothetical protein [Mameliella sp. AT18]KHQ53176.1 hypothetical protein OA50_02203 [Mameliella alba]ODM48238.1 hypothetical protein A9320_19395 [Ruegeria sp. PBVC088]
MPGPDPHAFWIVDSDPSSPRASYHSYLWTGNGGNRKARAIAILKGLMRRDWHCRWCGNTLPDYARADARYCRKAAARRRRAAKAGA